MEQKFYLCEHCGNMTALIKDSGVPMICCGQKMKELEPGSTDAAQEKHVPVCTAEGNMVSVAVGSVLHPMQPEHYIEWIALQSKEGLQLKHLHPGDEPKAVFALSPGDRAEAVYAYCNLHSLWRG